MSKAHPSPKQLRIERKRYANSMGCYGVLTAGDVLAFSTTGNVTLTVPQAFSAFSTGDTISFSVGDPLPRKTKRVHPARRNREKSDGLYVVTSVATNNLTYADAPRARRRIKRSTWIKSNNQPDWSKS